MAGNMPMRAALMACWGIGLAMLDSLAGDERVEVVMVLTRLPREQDPWAGAVMERAMELGIPTHSFEGMGFADMRDLLQNCRADLLLVHAYPRKLPESVFGCPRLGTVNVHPSLLPLYPGPDPTTRVLRDKARETGLTAHRMDEDYDSGPILCREKIFVNDHDTRRSVIERMKRVVPDLMGETISRVLNPDFKPTSQSDRLRDGEQAQEVTS